MILKYTVFLQLYSKDNKQPFENMYSDMREKEYMASCFAAIVEFAL